MKNHPVPSPRPGNRRLPRRRAAAWLATLSLVVLAPLATPRHACAQAGQPAEAAPKPNPVDLTPPAGGKGILIVTGDDYPGHLWRQTAPVLRGILEQDPRLRVRIVEDPAALASPQLRGWAVVVLHFMNWEKPGPGAAARENLRQFVAGGGGLMMTHFACGAWGSNEWPEFKHIAGRVYDPKLRPHDPYGKFRVGIAAPDHPITRGLAAFETTDELYTCLTGDAPIRVLAEAVSKVDQQEYPMAFVLEYGRGRVFQCVLGHNVQAYTYAPGMGALERRGCAWVAGLEPE